MSKDTTPIKDIEEIKNILRSFQFSLDNFKDGDTFDFETFSPAMMDYMAQQLQTYIDNKILEARIDELVGVLGDGTLHHYRVVAYINNRINELKSNQSKGNDNE